MLFVCFALRQPAEKERSEQVGLAVGVCEWNRGFFCDWIFSERRVLGENNATMGVGWRVVILFEQVWRASTGSGAFAGLLMKLFYFLFGTGAKIF